ncbi:MAG: hypothetical protein H6Q99_2309 [Proteobacteria bacterium]|nr:hypothetical protein [Pseudomonadota bacterium]
MDCPLKKGTMGGGPLQSLVEIRWGAADSDGFENRSGANSLFVSTGSAED